MFRKVVSVVLLLMFIWAIVPTAKADDPAINTECANIFTTQFSDAINFFQSPIWQANSAVLGGIIGLDFIVSFLENFEFGIEAATFGISLAPGGIFEPIDQAIEAIRNFLLTTMIGALVASAFNLLAGGLINAALALNFSLNVNNPLVTYGGKVILQITNLGLILAIIVIGIATILRREEFSVNKLLLKLVVAVALVNLTIPATSGIVGLGTTLTERMFNASAPCPGAMSTYFTVWHLHNIFMQSNVISGSSPDINTIVDSGEIQNQIGGASNQITGIPGGGTAAEAARNIASPLLAVALLFIQPFINLINFLLSNVLFYYASIAISVVAALTFFAMAIFLIIRFVILMLLLTFSPLIWLGFVFPPLKKLAWERWWKEFLKWVFFGPVIVLFLAFTSQYLSSAGAVSTTQAGWLVTIGQLIATIIISAMGLFLTAKFSGVAGNLVMAGVSGGVGFLVGKAQNLAKRGQMMAEMASKTAAAKGNKGAAAAFSGLSRGLRFNPAESGVGKGARSLLSQVGVKPTIKTKTDEEIRKGVVKGTVLSSTLLGESSGVLGISDKDAENMDSETFKVYAQHIGAEIAKDPAMVMKLGLKNVAKIMENGTEAVVNNVLDAMKQVKLDHLSGTSALNASDLTKVNKLLHTHADKVRERILDDLSGVTPKTDSALLLSVTDINKIKEEGSATEKTDINNALAALSLRTLGVGGTHLTADETREYRRVDAKVNYHIGKGDW
ncbi:MAG: hypothetical protein WC565_02440 [Parcubacteria group bacterium]